MYSGFLSAGNVSINGTNYSSHEHYFFVESENNSATDPLIIWTNGGPGASSFFGLFTELGPFNLDSYSLNTSDFNTTGVPTLWRN